MLIGTNKWDFFRTRVPLKRRRNQRLGSFYHSVFFPIPQRVLWTLTGPLTAVIISRQTFYPLCKEVGVAGWKKRHSVALKTRMGVAGRTHFLALFPPRFSGATRFKKSVIIDGMRTLMRIQNNIAYLLVINSWKYDTYVAALLYTRIEIISKFYESESNVNG